MAAALRTRDGQAFAVVNVDTGLRCTRVCAEVVAICMASAAGDTEIELIVAVNRKGRVVSPCGACRAMIADYDPDARVVVPGESGSRVTLVSRLLSLRYHKDGYPHWTWIRSANAGQGDAGAPPSACCKLTPAQS